MNRQRYVRRIVPDPARPGTNVRVDEGTQEAQALALALATVCDEQFLEALLHHKLSLDEFGGEVFIAAARGKFDSRGQLVEHNEPGSHQTTGYVFHYTEKSKVAGQPEEPDVPRGQVAPGPAEGSVTGGELRDEIEDEVAERAEAEQAAERVEA